MKNKYFYMITVLLIAVLIFSLGLSCSFCGKTLAMTNDESFNPASIEGRNPSEDVPVSVKDESGSLQATSEETLSQNEEKIAQEEKLAKIEKIKSIEAEKNANQDNQSQPSVVETVALKDNRFVIIIETMQTKDRAYSYANGNDPNFYETTDYFLNLGIPQEQIHIYWGQNQDGGTYDNFIIAIDDIKKLSNTGCIVLVALMSHGNKEGEFGAEAMIEFADGMGNEHGGRYISYYEVCSLLDQISCEKMAVIINSCALSDSAKPIAENSAFPRMAMAPITFQEILNYIFTDKSAVDRDRDGKYSIKDVLEFVKDPAATQNPARYTGVEMIDPFNIAGQIYLN